MVERVCLAADGGPGLQSGDRRTMVREGEEPEFLTAPTMVTWCAEPHRALAAGAVYYVLTGLLTLLRGPYRLSLMWGWVRRDAEE